MESVSPQSTSPSTLDNITADQPLHVVNLTRLTVVAHTLRLALTPLTRLRGLLWRPPLNANEGLLLRPCQGVHTFFMKYPIDVIFLNGEGKVLAVRQELTPWRTTPFIFEARAVLELAAKQIEKSHTLVGDQLSFKPKFDLEGRAI